MTLQPFSSYADPAPNGDYAKGTVSDNEPPKPLSLPDLPDLTRLIDMARARREHFIVIRDEAQAEIDNADAYLEALLGRNKAAPRSRRRDLSETTYNNVLLELSRHRYASASTVAGSHHVTTVNAAMRVAEKNGHATIEKVGRSYRYRITDAGLVYLTAHRVFDDTGDTHAEG